MAIAVPTALAAQGATQIAGDGQVVGFGEPCGPDGEMSAPDGVTIELTAGSLVGCWFTTEVTHFAVTPSGTIQERGRETLKVYDEEGDVVGTFSTTYKFTGKFEDGGAGDEIHGRCQHPIIKGSGTGMFEGVTGRVDFKDVDPAAGILEYRGHLK